MATFQRMTPRDFQAFQFNSIENVEPMELWDIINAEMNMLSLDRVNVTESDGKLVLNIVESRTVLHVIESRYDYIKHERILVPHVLNSTDWLVESGEEFPSMPTPVRVYEVMTHEQFLVFSQQENN